MAASNDDLFRRIAMLAGGGVSKSTEVLLDRVEDVMFLVLQRMVEGSENDPSRARLLARASKAASLFSRITLVAPNVTGRAVSASTYLGLRAFDATIGRAVRAVSGFQRS